MLTTINTAADVQDLLDLALDISELEVCSWKGAVRRAVELTPRLAVDACNDLRYVPAGYQDAPIEAHVCWSIPPRELAAVASPARVVYRKAVTDEWKETPCESVADARREQRALRRRGMIATVQFWQTGEQRWVG